jgi:hypothetical protein
VTLHKYFSRSKFSYWRPDLRCWLTKSRWCQLRSQHSASTLAGNQLLPNATLEHDGKFSYLLFPTPPIKLKLGLQTRGTLLIATHLGQSNYLVNQQHVLGFCCALYQPQQQHVQKLLCQNHFAQLNRHILTFLRLMFFCNIHKGVESPSFHQL